MAKPARPGLHPRITAGVAMGLVACLASAAPASRPEIPPSVPGEVIVRFGDAVPVCVETAFLNRASAALPAGLAETFARFRVEGVRAVFRPSGETALLAAGRKTLPISELRSAEQERVSRSLAARGHQLSTATAGAPRPDLFHVYRLRLGAETDVEEAIAALRRDPRVIYAEPNRIRQTSGLPDDPHVDPEGDGAWRQGSWHLPYADLWGLEASGWGRVWEEQSALWSEPGRAGGGGVVVAVVDSGADLDHPDLAGNLWRDGEGHAGADFVDIVPSVYHDAGFELVPGEDYGDFDFDPRDRLGHGTHVAGTVAAVAGNGEGIAGVAWASRVMVLRAGFVLRFQGGGEVGLLEDDDSSAALRWAADHGAQVVNMSFSGPPSAVQADALAYAASLGVVLVAAAGNQDANAWESFPAADPNVLAVAAVDAGGRRARFSNWGDTVDLAAPGRDVLSLRAAGTTLTGGANLVGDRYLRANGTSMAAPHVAGAAALVLSAHPEESAQDAVARLVAGAVPVGDTVHLPLVSYPLAGRLDVYRSLTLEPGPHLVVRSYRLDPEPSAESDGDNLAERGEGVDLWVIVENVWRSAPELAATLESADPRVTVLQGSGLVSPLERGQRGELRFRLRVDPLVPRSLPASLSLAVAGGGFSQHLDLDVEINPPAPFGLAAAAAGQPELDLEAEIAADAEGNFVTAWSHIDFEPRSVEVRARLYRRDGQPAGPLLPVARLVAGNSGGVTVARAPAGEFVVAWSRSDEDDTQFFIEARRYSASGTSLGPAFQVNETLARMQSQPRVVLGPDGRFVVAWYAGGQPNGADGFYARCYAANGAPLGHPFVLFAFAGNSDAFLEVAPAPDGGFFAAWRRTLTSGEVEVRGRRFRANGTPAGPDVRLDEGRHYLTLRHGLAARPGGGFLATWGRCRRPLAEAANDCALVGRRIDAGGALEGPEMLLSAPGSDWIVDTQVAVDAAGNFGVAWGTCFPAGFVLVGCDFQTRLFAADGTPLGQDAERDVADQTLSPRIAVAGGGFVTVWYQSGTLFSPAYVPSGSYAAISQLDPPAARCDPADPAALCLVDERFRVTVEWRDPQGGRGVGCPVPLRADSGAFWFFRDDNAELIVKVLDGTAINDHWWVFYGTLSNVEFTLTVADTVTGAVRTYFNPQGAMASRADLEALPGPRGDAAQAAAVPQAEEGGAQTSGEPCGGGPGDLCLAGGRFRVEVDWRTPQGGSGNGTALSLGDRTGAFWFFREDNLELVVKALDGTAINGRWWFFYGALSNVEYTITVHDTLTGATKTYVNPQGRMASVADTQAF